MRVFFDVGFHSTGIGRVAFNLAKYLPSDLTMASDFTSADLIVLHVNGRRDHKVDQARRFMRDGQQYAVIQYVMESCRNPHPEEWMELWGNAKVVWSYYDFREYLPNMYLAPLGADPDKFYIDPSVEKKYLCGTLGICYKEECLGEVRLASFLRGCRLVHVGDMIAPDPNCDNFKDISDDELRRIYNQCHYFSALRRKDGFELIAIESLLCGARPIMFDAPRFRRWFDDLAIFIPEKDPKSVVNSLQGIFKQELCPPTEEEIELVKQRFNWETIIKGFWERIKE